MVPALYLAFVGPPAVTGELIAGSAVTALSGSPWNVVWANPFCFGLAHAHHFVEKIRSGTPVVNALKITAAQLAYTSIFGVVATILFMRIGNIYSAILSHIICNSVGLPDVAFCNSPGNRKSDFYSCMYPYRYLHLMIHLIGLLLFTVLLFPFTEQFVADSLYWK